MKKLATILAIVLCLSVCAMSFTGCGEKYPDPTKGLEASQGLAFELASKIDGLKFENDYQISVEGDYYVCVGIGDCKDTDIVVPSEYNGLPVKAIGGFFGNANITSVTLPNSIEVIRSLAFGRNTNLKAVNCGNGVIIVEHGAFGTTTSLESITLSLKTEFIGWGCFHHSGLKTLNIPKSVKAIDYTIFEGATPETVNYAGSEDDWKKIEVNENNPELMDANFNYNVK